MRVKVKVRSSKHLRLGASLYLSRFNHNKYSGLLDKFEFVLDLYDINLTLT